MADLQEIIKIKLTEKSYLIVTKQSEENQNLQKENGNGKNKSPAEKNQKKESSDSLGILDSVEVLESYKYEQNENFFYDLRIWRVDERTGKFFRTHYGFKLSQKFFDDFANAVISYQLDSKIDSISKSVKQ